MNAKQKAKALALEKAKKIARAKVEERKKLKQNK